MIVFSETIVWSLLFSKLAIKLFSAKWLNIHLTNIAVQLFLSINTFFWWHCPCFVIVIEVSVQTCVLWENVWWWTSSGEHHNGLIHLDSSHERCLNCRVKVSVSALCTQSSNWIILGLIWPNKSIPVLFSFIWMGDNNKAQLHRGTHTHTDQVT